MLKAWVYLRRRIFSKIKKIIPEFGSELLYSKEIGGSVDLNMKGFEIRLLQSHELDFLKNVKANIDNEISSSLLDRGDSCFIGIIENKVVSFHWVQTAGLHFIMSINQHVPIDHFQAWIYNVRVHKNYRGRGINGVVLAKISNELYVKGFRQILIYTKQKNLSQINSLKKFGFSKINRFKYLSFLNRYYRL
jgi:ribosomal protein S18 acetylase RimI-like enzyme